MCKSRIVKSLFALVGLGVGGFLVWKYALNEPESLAEAQDGLSDTLDNLSDKAGDLSDKAGEKWDELDLDFSDFTNVLDGLGDSVFGELFSDDKSVGDNSTYNWIDDVVQPNNGGLHLTLLNALDDTWQEEFDAAVADWQKSDALELTKQQVEVDHTCQPKDGAMVVCNGNFGKTGWVGINENSLVGGVIVGSVSKMNEYYLLNAEYDERRYTMCHELGHGFGLPHTDEDPYNANLGNCLDYTNDPDENLLPGEVNMRKLSNMYLTRRRRRTQKDGTVVETTHLVKR